MVHNHNHHHHGESCSHEHTEEDKETYEVANKDSLYMFIDTEKLKCYNESSLNAGKSVFKPDDEKLDTTKFVESAIGSDILFIIPFTVACHVEKIEVLGGDENTAPAKIKIWKNKDDMDLEIAEEIDADQEFDIAYSHRILEFNVRRSKFIGCRSLVLYFPDCIRGKKTKIYYIGIRGKATQDKRGVVKCLYELMPQMEDHRIEEEGTGLKYKIDAKAEGKM